MGADRQSAGSEFLFVVDKSFIYLELEVPSIFLSL